MVCKRHTMQELVFKSCVVDKYSPSVPDDRLLGHINFGEYFGSVEDSSSNSIHKIISLGSGLMRKDSTICGGSMGVKIGVRVLSKR